MRRICYRHDQSAVVAALRRGEPIDMATSLGHTVLDELVALHEDLGVLKAVEELPVVRERGGVPDDLLLRTAAVLPFLDTPSLRQAAGQLFGEPAILLRLGWSCLQIEIGDNERHRHPVGRLPSSLPCHPDTLRDELRRVSPESWAELQRKGVKALFDHRLVRGKVYAIDGTGLGPDLRMVSLVCVSAQRPIIVAWRLLEGDASEKGKEAAVTRSLVEQALELGGHEAIELLLMDALYADGPLLAWLKHVKGIDVLVPVPSDRRIHADLAGLAHEGMVRVQRHSYVRHIQGHKQRRTVTLVSQSGLTSWDSFIEAAKGHGAEKPELWACRVEPESPTSADDLPWTLVSTRPWPDAVAAFQGFRPRWHIENDAFRELKEGWRLEALAWGRDYAMHLARVTLTCLAFNTAQVAISQSGQSLAARGIRRLRQTYQHEIGRAPCVIYIGEAYAVLPTEELLLHLGHTPIRSLLPLRTRVGTSLPDRVPP
jgi:hypothetical protein